MKGRVAFQGERGAFSHQASIECFPSLEPLACETFEEAILAVREGRAARAMLPIDNSIHGRVADIHHLLPQSGLRIVGEHFLRVKLALLGQKGSRLDGIREVFSHPVALGQCRRYLKAHGLKQHPFTDTAGSAAMVAQSDRRDRGAVASSLAAEIYGLGILAASIEDHGHNTTRFLAMAREENAAPPASLKGPCITSFVFRVRNVPAALYKAMGGFATNGVNMVRLESYMLNGSFTATQFAADIEGSPDQKPVARAFEELGFFTKHLTIMGVYPASPFRHGVARRHLAEGDEGAERTLRPGE